MEKILTIVIPTYNMQDYLRRCLDSLIVPEKQMQHLEVLVVNDGSKDNSSAIAHEYQDKYPDTFRVIDKENGNYGSCVNRGLKEATGKYIKILDADDWYDTEVLTNFIALLLTLDVDLVVTDFVFVNSLGKVTGNEIRGYKQNCILNFAQEYDTLVKSGAPMFSITYKTCNLRRIDYKQTEGISYTDTEWSFIPMIMVNTFYYYPHFLYKYLKGREGQTVEGITYIKRTPQRMQIFLRLLKELGTLDRSKKQTMYFEFKIRQFALEIYRILIVECPSVIDGKVLIDFDTEIKKLNHIFYKELASDKIKKYYPVKYIAQWRNNGGKIPFLVKIFAVCRKIVKK